MTLNIDLNNSSSTPVPNLSKQEYVEIISTIKNPQTKDEKIRFHLAIGYVRLNLNNLDKNELKILIRNESFIKTLGKDFDKKIGERYSQLNLQEMTKQKCLDIFNSSNKPILNDDKYQFHLALTYFKENLMDFDAKELKIILSNDYVNTHKGKKFDIEVMEKCIEKKKSFPITLHNSKWQQGTIAKDTLHAYLDIIHAENNEEQLKFFCIHRTRDIGEYIQEKGYKNVKVSPLLEELYLKANPQYILQVNWPEEKSCAWLDKYNAVAPTLFPMLYLYENKLGDKFKTKIYESVIEQLFDPNYGTLSNKRIIISNDNPNFLNYLEKNYSNELRDFLSTKINEPFEIETTLNIAQELICSINLEHGNASKTLYNIICKNKDLLLEPIIVESRLYEKEISIFERGLENTTFLVCAPFSLNDSSIEPEHRKQILATAFCLLQAKHEVFNNEDSDGYDRHISNLEYLNSWYPNIISQATNEELAKYTEKAIKGNEENTKFVKEIKAIMLKVELNRELSNNSTPTARMKI